jgi:hypothetical protein
MTERREGINENEPSRREAWGRRSDIKNAQNFLYPPWTAVNIYVEGGYSSLEGGNSSLVT